MKTTKEKIDVLTECIAIIKEFDAGLAKPEETGSDIVRELLKEGKPVLCGVSDKSQSEACSNASNLDGVVMIVSADRATLDSFEDCYRYASPVDTSKFASYVPEVKG